MKSAIFWRNLGAYSGLSLFCAFVATPAHAQQPSGITAYATSGTQLYRFDTGLPNASVLVGDIGFAPEGIDFNPATGQLFALEVEDITAQLFTLDLTTAAPTPVGFGFPSSGTGTSAGASPMGANVYDLARQSLGFDFNPKTLQSDGSIRIRVVASNGSDIRLNSATGGVAGVDGTLTANGTTTSIVGAAYTNNVAQMGGSTVLYDISDTGAPDVQDRIFIQNPPNSGTLISGRPLGFDVQATVGFDIFTGPTGTGNTAFLASDDPAGAAPTEFFTVDLAGGTTGAATPAGNFGTLGISDIAVQPLAAGATIPVVRSITRGGAPATSTASSVNFTVNFSEVVTGVDASDFVLTQTGNLSGATITGVTDAGNGTFIVTVSGITGNGVLRLDVADNDSIVATSDGEPLGGAGAGNGSFTTGEAFVFNPVVRSITRAAGSANPTPASSVNFTVTFSEAVTGVDASDFIATAMNMGAAVTLTPTADAAVYTVTVSGFSGNGTVSLAVNDDDTIRAGTAFLGGVGLDNGDFNGGETFTVNMSATSGAIISEFRLRGPAGSNDEYVELLNTTKAPLDISGYTITNSASALVLTVPDGTILPLGGHFLFTANSFFGPRYSLQSYANGDLGYLDDIPDSASLTLVNGLGTPIDTTSASSPTADGQFALVRLSPVANSGFTLVSTTGDAFGSAQIAVQGAPGPQSLTSPAIRNDLFSVALFDTTVGPNSRPNQVRVSGATSTSAPLGTLLFRRRLTNNGTTPITRLRLRVTRLTTFGASSGAQSDLRLISSPDEMRNSGSQGLVPVSGFTLEAPSTEGVAGGASATGGGGLNSSIIDIDVDITPLAPGEMRNINILFGVVRSGSFALNLDIEALLATPATQ